MDEGLNRVWYLRRRPVGLPVAEDFELHTEPLPDLTDGQALVRIMYVSVDPYMRGRMSGGPGSSAFGQQPLQGAAVGRISASRHPEYANGEYVLLDQGWRNYAISDGTGLTRIDPELAPLSSYLGVLGMPGLTAYVGMFDIGHARAGGLIRQIGGLCAILAAARALPHR